MKTFTIAVIVAVLACNVFAQMPMSEDAKMNEETATKLRSYGAAPSYSAPSYSAPAAPAYHAPAAPSYSAPSSYPAPACPTNYLYSCAPHISPVPCSQSYGGY